jgi:hypothetical protein
LWPALLLSHNLSYPLPYLSTQTNENTAEITEQDASCATSSAPRGPQAATTSPPWEPLVSSMASVGLRWLSMSLVLVVAFPALVSSLLLYFIVVFYIVISFIFLIIYYLLFIIYYLLFIIYYLLFIIYYLLFVICYLLFVICYLLFVICVFVYLLFLFLFC